MKVPGSGESFNQNLEHAGRVADFLEFAEQFSCFVLVIIVVLVIIIIAWDSC